MPQEEHRIAALEAVNIPREIRARSRRRHQPLIQAVDDQNVARPLPSIHQAMVVGEALCAIGTAPPSAQVSEPAGSRCTTCAGQGRPERAADVRTASKEPSMS
eukprot:CAMPEP_0177535932 /NCGR_PEP_ID=MMETSP0369-20130122/56865_1 /TAXON_ID=447022 ORGANISM="Scrippsiella hangoei-like, Strain SHHI-4" /NCGR_SAMPLE_ID=MMETSP0369 /ASSEMBLY_ACC=CAM_ASM_000364 /LENGTH=102 /DNA_ID=CAMNT_0019018225 /DNA_START=303 /DNA_END=611 /DNA_ORIENTATION=-